jgi:hypothetical protein
MPLFPYKLHELLTEMQSSTHLSSIISWVPSGNAFKIHQPELFQEILLKKYFPRQTKINSFKRQLLYYGFDNLGDNIFAHPCFVRDKRNLCGQINHSNPTKSQREAKTSIPSRRVRGKRAKQALRHKLIETPSCQASMINSKAKNTSPVLSATPFSLLATPAQLPTNFSFLPLPAISGESSSALAQTLLQNRAMPLDYWRKMSSVPANTNSGGDVTPPKVQSFPLPDCSMLQASRMSEQSRMALAMFQQQQRQGTNMVGGLNVISA